MADKHGYFRLLLADGTTKIEMIPPEGNGEPFALDDLSGYLDRARIDYNILELKNAYDTVCAGTVVFPLLPNAVYAESEKMMVRISDDNMTVTVKFFAPSDNGSLMDLQEIVNDLFYKGVKAGIKKEAIESFLANREYCKEYVFAEGEPAQRGTDASIEYHFNTDLSLKPTVLEDGSVDFHNLNNISPVCEGDLLATLIKEVPGKMGYNVLGDKIRPSEVRKKRLNGGLNMTLSEDRCKLYSAVNGHVTLINETVFVSNTYEVEDVGSATGDIVYDGNVNVKGNVCTGFKVIAKGDIEVGGVVEGAELQAGGQIILKRGVQGGGRAKITAKSNIVAKFIESAIVSAEGYVRTNSILHSQVSAKGEVEVSGKKGFVTGGVVRSTTAVIAKTIGSETGSKTIIEVGVDPVQKEKFAVLGKEIANLEAEMGKVYPVLVAFGKRIGQGERLDEAKMAQMKQLSVVYAQQEKDLSEKKKEFEEMQECMEMDSNAKIKVTGDVYPGVQLVISDVSLNVKAKETYCQFVKEGGDVRRKQI